MCVQIESTAAAAGISGGPTPVHGTPEGSSCCQLTLRSAAPTSTTAHDVSSSSSLTTSASSPVECVARSQSKGRRSPSQMVIQQSGDRPQSSPSPCVGNRRAVAKSSLPLSKVNDGRRTVSARSTNRSQQRSPGETQQRRTAVVGGITVADDVTTVSSSSDAYSDDTTSSANDQNSASPLPGR